MTAVSSSCFQSGAFRIMVCVCISTKTNVNCILLFYFFNVNYDKQNIFPDNFIFAFIVGLESIVYDRVSS